MWYNEENETKGDAMKIAEKIIKGLILLLIFSIVAFLIFRIWLSSYYPKEAGGLIFTDGLLEYYEENGEVDAKTQQLRFNYDDSKEGYFFAGELIVVPEAGALQISLRYNDSTLSALREKYPESFSGEGEIPFSFRLVGAPPEEGANGPAYSPIESKPSRFLMYNYERLCFEGIDFDDLPWMRIEVYLPGEEKAICTLLVYENHAEYNAFTPYSVKRSELP